MKSIMELAKDFFLQRSLLYCIIAFFSFFVVVPLGDLRIRFKDDHCSRCILYSEVVANQTSGFHIRFGEQEVCEYILAVTSVFCMMYPLVAVIAYVTMYRRDSQEVSPEQKLDLSHFLFVGHVITEVCVVVMVMVSAAMVTAGMDELCDSVTSLGAGNSCSDGQKLNVWGVYDGSNFHDALTVATVGSWFLFLSWLLQGLLGVWKLWRLGLIPVCLTD